MRATPTLTLIPSCFFALYFFVLLFLSFFDFDLDVVFVSSCLFLVGTKLSPPFLLRVVQRIICIWYVRTLISLLLFLSEAYDLFQLLCVLPFVIFFPPEVIFHAYVLLPRTALWR